MIKVRYRARLRDLTKRDIDEIDAQSVGDVYRHIRRVYGSEAYREAARMLVTVDGTSILLQDNRRTALQSGAEVCFLPPLRRRLMSIELINGT